MSIIKKIILKSLIILFLNSFSAFSNEVQKVGKFKDWDVMVLTNQTEKYVLPNQNLFCNHLKKTKEMRDFL